MSVSPEECAREVVTTVLLLMHSVYSEVKSCDSPDLSVSQFRALAFLRLRPGASLSDVAEHLGISLPSTSKMVDGFVARQLVTRQTSSTDRRYVTLSLTAQGKSVLGTVRQSVELHVTKMLTALSETDRTTVLQAMEALQSVLAPGPQAEAGRVENA